jgi:uncharacterized protein (DUF2252 family)
MMRPLLSTLLLVLLTSITRAQNQPLQEPTRPFDYLERTFAPYLDAKDPLAFPAKVRSLAMDRYAFWRGAKDLYFLWCKNNAQNWLADTEAVVTQQGDQHLGNIGTYMTGRNFGSMAFGMVDFDDSHRLPFQFELLQGIITLRLTAEANQVSLSDDQLDQLISHVLENYELGTSSAKTATELVEGDQTIIRMQIRLARRNYARELKEYTEDSERLRPAVPHKGNKTKDVFRPAMDRADALAEGISQAIARSPDMVRIFNYHTPAQIRKAMKDVAQRTRMGSAGSQGVKKFFVLLDRPLVGVDHDAMLYIKQEIPTAPERVGIVPPDPRTPGQRCAEDMALLSHPPPFLNGWFQMGNESYWVTLREPWTDELDSDDIKTLEDLRRVARIWALAAGTTHKQPGQAAIIKKRIGPELSNDLRRYSNAFLLKLDADFKDFKADPRCGPLIATANAAMEAIRDGKPAPDPAGK